MSAFKILMLGAGGLLVFWSLREMRIIGPLATPYLSPTKKRTTE